jgi:choline kinase
MQYPKHAIILAAGLGSRLGMDLPKCLVDLHGRKLIDYQLDLLKLFADVRVVVGFKEEDVISYVSKIRSDCVFVRNPDYFKTTNVCSAKLGTKYITRPFVIMDGDIYIPPQDFQAFISICISSDTDVVGVTPTKSEEPVYAHVSNGILTHFSLTEYSQYEWAGLAYIKNADFQQFNIGYIYQILANYLPAPASIINVYEVDTPQDYSMLLQNVVINNPTTF